jgi:hypothetical protein
MSRPLPLLPAWWPFGRRRCPECRETWVRTAVEATSRWPDGHLTAIGAGAICGHTWHVWPRR